MYVLFVVNTACVLNMYIHNSEESLEGSDCSSTRPITYMVCVCAGDLHVPGVVSTGGGEFAGVLHLDLSVGRQDVVPLYGQW